WGLLRSIPRLDAERGEELVPIAGRPPSLINPPGGCSFHPRCPYVQPRHREVQPQLVAVPGGGGHAVACLLEHETRTRLWQALRDGAVLEHAAATAIAEAAREAASAREARGEVPAEEARGGAPGEEARGGAPGGEARGEAQAEEARDAAPAEEAPDG
ncbi:MAG: peptide/nickel transport system ATP-binding protein, partial [Solirubrobacteraceae bacterium]|nr:peptide/nickel transport system ATP-binding protein [Solirubrobacteraceae bacterium]